MWFKVSVVTAGDAVEDLGVEASSESEARKRARDAGFSLTTASTYEIGAYGLRFVHARLPLTPPLA